DVLRIAKGLVRTVRRPPPDPPVDRGPAARHRPHRTIPGGDHSFRSGPPGVLRCNSLHRVETSRGWPRETAAAAWPRSTGRALRTIYAGTLCYRPPAGQGQTLTHSSAAALPSPDR